MKENEFFHYSTLSISYVLVLSYDSRKHESWKYFLFATCFFFLYDEEERRRIRSGWMAYPADKKRRYKWIDDANAKQESLKVLLD